MFKQYKQVADTSSDSESKETKTLGFEEPPPAATYEPPPKLKGTIVPYADCDEVHLEADSQALRAAMKGLGTDELTIIHVLTKYSNEQRQQLRSTYKTQFGRDLLTDMKDETSGSFRATIEALMVPSRLYDVSCMHDAVERQGTDAMIDILCPRSNEELHAITEGYSKLYPKRVLEKDITQCTSGDIRRLLISILQGNRESADTVDQEKAKKDANDLYKAGEAKLGTDEEVFNRIFALRSLPHLKAVSEEYQKAYGIALSTSIKGEFSGAIKDGLLAIVRYAENPVKYFADRIANIKGSDDSTLRFLVSHSETDLHEIKQYYHQYYRSSLEYTISKTESGDFRKLLIKILNPTLENEKLHSMCK